MEKQRKKIGAILRKKRNGKTVYDIVKASGLSPAQIHGIEKGDKSYTIDSYIKILSAHKIPFTIEDNII